MKVTVNNNKKENKQKFPCLMISEVNSNMIILAMGEEGSNYTGTVLANACDYFKLGEYDTVFDKGEFEPFNGSITLSNE